MSFDQVTAEAMALTPQERRTLADALYDSVPAGEVFDAEYMKGILRRVEELESGKVQGIPHEEVMQEAWRIVNAAD